MSVQIDAYIEELERSLRSLPKADKEDAVKEIYSHIYMAISSGIDEQTVLSNLEPPTKLAESLIAEMKIEQARENPKIKSTIRAIFSTVRLGILHVFFVLFPVSVLYLVQFAFIGFGIVCMFVVPSMILMDNGFSVELLKFGFVFLSFFGFGLLLLTLMMQFTVWYSKGVLSYLLETLRRARKPIL
ncbi:HAAS signaling domain-containing protein [Paenibacillus segetis]|uniref:DUF1700 domain-containing protein n=1 Tax=Paenibacillus segetis TaxID=1325360 RepID=A0ABQ1YK10_9BACL|nr:DUF1700 domain-containing protein [Paenibacillus segetis]GGH29040.1 hypothetical protein GCM10008013_31400 [Paenibacillus segetis]